MFDNNKIESKSLQKNTKFGMLKRSNRNGIFCIAFMVSIYNVVEASVANPGLRATITSRLLFQRRISSFITDQRSTWNSIFIHDIWGFLRALDPQLICNARDEWHTLSPRPCNGIRNRGTDQTEAIVSLVKHRHEQIHGIWRQLVFCLALIGFLFESRLYVRELNGRLLLSTV